MGFKVQIDGMDTLTGEHPPGFATLPEFTPDALYAHLATQYAEVLGRDEPSRHLALRGGGNLNGQIWVVVEDSEPSTNAVIFLSATEIGATGAGAVAAAA